jgi:ubiquinone/menaquinone biosynthesis C-methylase UbiE
VIDQLTELVGPGGHVTGLDFNPANVALARDIARERGLENVEIVEGDARHTGLPDGSFDLVHARTLLINVPSPDGVLAEMVRLVRPGGVVTSWSLMSTRPCATRGSQPGSGCTRSSLSLIARMAPIR